MQIDNQIARIDAMQKELNELKEFLQRKNLDRLINDSYKKVHRNMSTNYATSSDRIIERTI